MKLYLGSFLLGCITMVVLFYLYKLYRYFVEPMELSYVYEKESLPVKQADLPENLMKDLMPEEEEEHVGPLREVEAEYPAIYEKTVIDTGSYVNQDNSYYEGDLEVTPL